MNDWRELSRMPKSPEYWNDLTARMQQSLQDVEVEPAPIFSLAPFAWTAVAAALAAVLVSSYLPVSAVNARSFEAALAPTDSIGAAWLANATPPTVMEALMAVLR